MFLTQADPLNCSLSPLPSTWLSGEQDPLKVGLTLRDSSAAPVAPDGRGADSFPPPPFAPRCVLWSSQERARLPQMGRITSPEQWPTMQRAPAQCVAQWSARLSWILSPRWNALPDVRIELWVRGWAWGRLLHQTLPRRPTGTPAWPAAVMNGPHSGPRAHWERLPQLRSRSALAPQGTHSFVGEGCLGWMGCAQRTRGTAGGSRGPFWTTPDKNADFDTRLGQGWSIWPLAKDSTSVSSISGHRAGMFKEQFNGEKAGIQSWVFFSLQKEVFVGHNLLWLMGFPTVHLQLWVESHFDQAVSGGGWRYSFKHVKMFPLETLGLDQKEKAKYIVSIRDILCLQHIAHWEGHTGKIPYQCCCLKAMLL